MGCGLIVFACALSDEFGSRPMSSTRNVLQFSTSFMDNESNIKTPPHYNYGWSFMLAVLGFLCSEVSAVLCLTAFLNRFDTEVHIHVYYVQLYVEISC